MLKFEPVTEYDRGIIFSLLRQSLAELWNEELEKKIKQYDTDVFDNPDTVGACVFVTCLGDKAIGMASWDPRQGPEKGILGYNCIVPACQGKGYGKAQITEILRRLKIAGFQKVVVTTGEHPFFLAAVKMYLAYGFKEIRRHNNGNEPNCGMIDYEIRL